MSAELSPRAWTNIALFQPFVSFADVSKLSGYVARHFVLHRRDTLTSASDRLHPGYLESEGIRVQSGVYTVADFVERIFREGPQIVRYDGEATLPSGLVEAITQVSPFECLCDKRVGKQPQNRAGSACGGIF